MSGVDHKAFATLLTALFDRPVGSERDKPHRDDGEATFGLFFDAEGDSAGVIAFDLGLAAASAAALSLRPAPDVDELEAPLDGSIHADFYEVINVLGGIANQHSRKHLRLRSIEYGAPAEHWDNSWRVRAFSLDIKGYGAGKVTIALRHSS